MLASSPGVLHEALVGSQHDRQYPIVDKRVGMHINVSSRSPRCRHVIESVNIRNSEFVVLDRVSDPWSILLNWMKSW